MLDYFKKQWRKQQKYDEFFFRRFYGKHVKVLVLRKVHSLTTLVYVVYLLLHAWLCEVNAVKLLKLQ